MWFFCEHGNLPNWQTPTYHQFRLITNFFGSPWCIFFGGWGWGLQYLGLTPTFKPWILACSPLKIISHPSQKERNRHLPSIHFCRVTMSMWNFGGCTKLVLGQGAWNSTSLSSQATKHLNLEEDGCLGNLGWWREMMPKQEQPQTPGNIL